MSNWVPASSKNGFLWKNAQTDKRAKKLRRDALWRYELRAIELSSHRMQLVPGHRERLLRLIARVATGWHVTYALCTLYNQCSECGTNAFLLIAKTIILSCGLYPLVPLFASISFAFSMKMTSRNALRYESLLLFQCWRPTHAWCAVFTCNGNAFCY